MSKQPDVNVKINQMEGLASELLRKHSVLDLIQLVKALEEGFEGR